jgi:uncharacterized membrane protein YgcG
MNRASSLLGAMPRIMPGLQDAAAVLNAREMRELKNLVLKLKLRFPQVNVHLVVRSFSTEQPFELYVFWIFNAANLSEEFHKGGENRDVLIVLDPTQMRVGLMVGYGLEPFVSEEALDHLLAMAEPMFREKRWIDGFARLLKGLDLLLEAAALNAAEALGVTTKFDLRSGDAMY